MNSKNDWIREYLGVAAWHRAGYTGRRGLTASGEDFVSAAPRAHAKKSLEALREIAPDRQCVYLPVTDPARLVAETRDKGIDTMFVSMTGMSFGVEGRRLIDGNLVESCAIFVSAGNDGSQKSNPYMNPERIYGVGAANLVASDSKGGVPLPGATITPVAAGYSSESERVDFAGVTGLYLSDGRPFTGTSCAAPVLCGMAALINDMAMEKTGKPLPAEAVYRFFKECARDIDARGKDVKTGWGLPVLPPPETIDIWRYADMQTYKDDQSINPAHKEEVYRARELGLMSGHNDRFDPKSPLTREQAASIAVRIYDMLRNEVKV